MRCKRMLPGIFLLILTNAFVMVTCVCFNNGNYTTNSTYSANLDAVLSSLSTNINSTGFYSTSVGQNRDTANAIALCRGDVQLDTCRSCIRNASVELPQACPNYRQAIEWYELCMLRYSNDTIFGTMATSPGIMMWNLENATSPDQFWDDLTGLLSNIRNRAAFSGDSLRKVAAGNTTAPDFQTIYALVQCTPDLSAQDCYDCLTAAAQALPGCCDGKVGANIRLPSCALRYEIYRFYNETRLQELEATTEPAPVPSIPSPPGPGNEGRTIIIVVVSIVSCIILAVVVGILLIKRRKQKPEDRVEEGEDVEEISTAESLQYSFATIRAATNDFSDDNKLGQGGFGAVYRGKLQDDQEIAVKRLSMNSGQGDTEFKNEVLLLARLQHRNLVRLLGFSIEGQEKLLVYEYVQNTSLDHFIFDQVRRSHLDCDRRYKIIMGIAKGILYLHEDSRLRIIHRDLKPSNVLLDGDMNPKISDFGMARLFMQDETQGNTSRPAGTYGYMPPEYALHGLFSVKSDVFSFGVMVLEIVSGQKNNAFHNGDYVEDLLSSAWRNWHEGTLANIIDPVLRSGSGSMRDLMRCIHIGLLCVQENAADRPTMASVVLMLNSSSLTLAVPTEPAFFTPNDDSEASLLQEFNSREHSKSPVKSAQSAASSNNDVSITEFHPR